MASISAINLSHRNRFFIRLILLIPSNTWSASENLFIQVSGVSVPDPEAVLEADLFQVAEVMGLEEDIEVTDDVGEADVNSSLKF
ncbi:hypothetical protein Bca4012_091116 [Brassica carinata]